MYKANSPVWYNDMKGKKIYQNHHVDYEKDYTIPLKKSHHFCVSRYFQTLKGGNNNALDVVNFLIAVLFELRRILGGTNDDKKEDGL